MSWFKHRPHPAINIPTKEIPVKINRKPQSITIYSTSPIKPINDLTAIIINEVPIAFFMGSPVQRTKAGMIKNPPPAPTIPVNNPTMAPWMIKDRFLYFISGFFSNPKPPLLII